jgi:mannose-6-phosphate isomerase
MAEIQPDATSSTIVNKPWGHELIWAKTDRYVGKILHVRAGEALSLQYHRVKDETIMVLAGRLRLEFFVEDESPRFCDLDPHTPFHIAPGLRHRMIAIEDTAVLEVSTPELDDVVRLKDRYGRAPAAPVADDEAALP